MKSMIASMLAAISTPALAQIGDARTGITWGELGWVVGALMAAVVVTIAVMLYLGRSRSEDKGALHRRIDDLSKSLGEQIAATAQQTSARTSEISEQTNSRFLGFVEQMTKQQQLMDAKIHSIELLMANRYVTKEDLHKTEGIIISAVDQLRSDVRVVHERLNKDSPS